jgi:hypothetical protein
MMESIVSWMDMTIKKNVKILSCLGCANKNNYSNTGITLYQNIKLEVAHAF